MAGTRKTATTNGSKRHSRTGKLVTWNDVLKQKPLWYQTDEAARIADQVILYQKENGGWEKNIDMAAMLTQKEKDDLLAKASDISETTIDNRTSYTQVEFLGKDNYCEPAETVAAKQFSEI